MHVARASRRATVTLGAVADARSWPMRLRVGAGLFLMASLHIVGCSQGGRSPSGHPATGSTLRLGPDAQLVRDYVAAVDGGDIRGAMALRCTAARIKSSDEQLFETQVTQLRDQLGSMSVASVRAAEPIGLEPSQDGDHPRQMLVRLSYGGRTAERSLRLIAVDENDERRLCGALADPPIAPQDLPAPRDLARRGPHPTRCSQPQDQPAGPKSTTRSGS